MDIEAKLKDLLYEIDDEIDMEAISPDSLLKEDLGLSSVAMLYMAVSIENEFEIDLSEADMSQLRTVSDVVDLVSGYLGSVKED
ncbi:MAG: acyl carrier protein [Parasporobacterium sp.]|nr:acyl carrier protein [Parasporobacterium sp.]